MPTEHDKHSTRVGQAKCRKSDTESRIIVGGIDPNQYYCDTAFADILRIGENRRDRLIASLRRSKRIVENGHHPVFLGRDGIDVLRSLKQ